MAADVMMEDTPLSDPRTELICARLYLRRGKRQLRAGAPAAAASAIYDAMLFGMRYYIAKHAGCTQFTTASYPWDAVSLFHSLASAGVFDDPLALNRLSLVVEHALWQGAQADDINAALNEVEQMLFKLGVLPLRISLRSDKSQYAH